MRIVSRPGAGRIPLTIVTGFLGSGKTTLIRRFLASEAGRKTAVIVNEFGEIGIDDALLRSSSERTVLLGNGCLCCAASSDLQRTLRDLFADRTRGIVPDFERVVIETSGLADPGPLLQMLATDRPLADTFSFSGVLTVVDALHAKMNAAIPEWRKQVACADKLFLSKRDLCNPAQIKELRVRLADLAPIAELCGADDAGSIIAGSSYPLSRSLSDADLLSSPSHSRSSDYVTFAIVRDEPIGWKVLHQSLETLSTLCGEKLLRLKGFLNVRGAEGPVVLHQVQHVVHPPEMLKGWPRAPRTELVFIGRGLSRIEVSTLLDAVWAFDQGTEPGES